MKVFLTKLELSEASWHNSRGHENRINYVDTQMDDNCSLEEIIAMKVLNPFFY